MLNRHIPLSFPMQGIGFVDTLYKVWTKRKCNLQGFDTECKTWLLLLLQLVEVTGDHPDVLLQRFFLGKNEVAEVVKRYQDDIINHVSA